MWYTDSVSEIVDFQSEVVEASSDKAVVVDLWAPWCGPCRALGPVIEEEASAADINLVKIDIDQQPELAQELGVSSIPSVKAFHKGELVGEFVGALPRQRVREWLQTLPR